MDEGVVWSCGNCLGSIFIRAVSVCEDDVDVGRYEEKS